MCKFQDALQYCTATIESWPIVHCACLALSRVRVPHRGSLSTSLQPSVLLAQTSIYVVMQIYAVHLWVKPVKSLEHYLCQLLKTQRASILELDPMRPTQTAFLDS